jgi:hypothetical protein
VVLWCPTLTVTRLDLPSTKYSFHEAVSGESESSVPNAYRKRTPTESKMRNRTATVLIVFLILASGAVGYSVGVSVNQTAIPPPSPPSHPREQMILAASCSPVGNTGAIIAVNTGAIPVNLTEVTISNSSGIHIEATFQYGILVNSGNYATLSQGIGYSGSNATIMAVSMYGTVFATKCPTTN